MTRSHVSRAPRRTGRPRAVSGERRRTSRAGWAHANEDDGQITLLAIAFAMLALLLVTAVVSATGIHLERKRLLALADALSLEAADGVRDDAVYDGQGQVPVAGGVIPLTDRDVARAVDEYLADNPEAAGRFEDLAVEATVSTDGRTAEVRLSAIAHPTLISWVTAPWSDGVVLHAQSSARAW